MIPVLESERLILRGIRQDDFPAYAEFYAGEASHFVGGPLEPSRSWRALAAAAGSWLLHGYGKFAVEEKATGSFAGLVGPWFPEGWPEPEIAWTILPRFQRRGYGTEAARRALAFAYDDLGWTTAVSCIAADNAASVGIARRLGARFEGEAEVRPYGVLPVYRHLSPEAFRRALH